MARTPKPQEPSNSLVASAARVNDRSFKSFARLSSSDGWQAEAWKMYHSIGEFRYACDWVGALLSRAVIIATKVDKDGKQHPADGNALAFVSELFGDEDGRSEMLRLLGIHFTVAGEAWIVGYDDPDDPDDDVVWQVVAASGLVRPASKNGYWKVNGEQIRVDPDEVYVARLWRPDPLDGRLAISPARAVLNILGEISRLTDHVAAQVDSRLAGAGILLMPSEMTFPAPPEAGAPEGTVRSASSANDLMKIIQSTMATAIENRSDPSALVPIVITAPAAAIDAVKHMTFWTELDAHAIELRNEAIRRLALGMDMPPEVLTGSGDSNHWNAWQADESAIKSHTEPLLKIITTALAKGYLRPLLRDSGEMDARAYSLAADTSEMRLRPNRSKEALELYDRGALNAKALRRETGFDEDDVMDDEDRKTWLMLKVASGATTPELVEAALVALGVVLDVKRPEAESAETTEARPTPSLVEHPVRDIPDQRKQERRKEVRDTPEGLVAACEQVVVRALERAGNKLKNTMSTKPRVPAAEVYQFVTITPMDTGDLLDDAWAHVPPIADRYGVDVKALTGVLEEYCSAVMVNAKPHDYGTFSTYLRISDDLKVVAA